MKINEYKCTQCKKVFEKGWSEEESRNEAKESFGKDIFETTEMMLICDDCYKELIK